MIRCVVFLTIHLLALCCSPTTFAQSWTRFRGFNGAGISTATTIPTDWTAEDFRWKVALPGRGHSSPVVGGNRLIVTSGDESTGTRVVLAVDVRQGEILWQRSFAAEPGRKHALNSYASGTPVIDEHHIYVVWGTAEETIILALDHEGKTRWEYQSPGFSASHGFAASPVLYRDRLILAIEDGQSSRWVALNAKTGKVIWQHEQTTQLHYATPCVFRSTTKTEELIFTNYEYGICGVNPEDGKIRWQAKVFDSSHVEASIASPVIAGDLVIGTCGYLGHGNEVIALRPQQDQVLSPVWRIDRGAPLCPTPVVKNKLIFLWSDKGIVTCADVATGKKHWQRRIGSTFYSSPICVGNFLYNTSVDGEMVVLDAKTAYRLVARNDLGEGSHSTAAVANGVMYVRTFSHLMAVGGAAPPEPVR